MERLTNKREADQQRQNYEKRMEQDYPRNIPEERFLRLAAYEDTGLTPEQVKDMAENAETCLLTWFESRYGFPVGELMGILEAKQQDRLLIAPCKVGDLLYEVDLPEYGIIVCEVLTVSTYEGPAGHVRGNETVAALSIGVEVIEGHGLGSSYAFEVQDFGESVFLTRKEAEAVLKEKSK